MSMTPCLSQKPENCCCYARVSRLWTLKTPIFMARKRWRHNVLRKLARVSLNTLWVLQLIGQSNYVWQTECIRIPESDTNFSHVNDSRVSWFVTMIFMSEFVWRQQSFIVASISKLKQSVEIKQQDKALYIIKKQFLVPSDECHRCCFCYHQ